MNKITVVATVLLCAFGVFGWPTAYRYDILWEGVTDIDSELDNSNQVIYRINRWTGHAERLAPLPQPPTCGIIYRHIQEKPNCT